MRFLIVRLTSINRLSKNSHQAFKLTWSTHAPLTVGVIGFTLVLSIMPAAIALVARGLINAVVTTLDSEAKDISAVLPWLALGLGLQLIREVSSLVNRFFNQRLSDELNLKITLDILTHAAKLDLAFFEDPRFQDVIARAQQNAAGHFSQFVNNTLGAITSISPK